MQFQKISTPCKAKKFEEMYEAYLEFPEGWGGLRKNPFRGGGMDIFWNYTLTFSVGEPLGSQVGKTF